MIGSDPQTHRRFGRVRTLAGPDNRLRHAIADGEHHVRFLDRLVFTAIPPRSRFPLTVTVVAWQWGRAAAPAVQSAPLAERSFRITSDHVVTERTLQSLPSD